MHHTVSYGTFTMSSTSGGPGVLVISLIGSDLKAAIVTSS